MSKFSIVLLSLSMILATVGLFIPGTGIALYLISTCLLFVMAGHMVSDAKIRKGYTKNWDFVIGELDLVIIMVGVLLFGIKFLVAEPLSTSLHLLFLSTIFFSFAIRHSKRKKRDE